MTGWMVLAGYVGGYVFTYRRIYTALDSDPLLGSSDKFDMAGNAIVAMISSVLWPIVIAGYYLWRLATPVTPRQRQAELDERERRVAQLERELGIGPYERD